MTEAPCTDMHLLIQADIDGELAPAEAARVAAHADSCPACAALQKDLLALGERVRRDATYHKAPASLRRRLAVLVPEAARPVSPVVAAGSKRRWWSGPAPSFGLGLALAASVALWLPRGEALPDTLVASHIRALQPGHLTDVLSTDRHTVKPWFNGRLDFAPPVNDWAAQGFPLTGGRLDYLAGHPAAVLTYQRRQHVIDLYVWPDDARLDAAPARGQRNGYNFVHWRSGGMAFWAISDVAAPELAAFADLARAG